MGSTIYTQKLKHAVYVTFTCEHCGQYNAFSEEIVGVGSTEVQNISSDRAAQEKISKLGPKAQTDLARKIQKVRIETEKGNYAWLKLHRCTKCRYVQSWQTSRLWKRTIRFFALDIFIIIIFFSWLTGSSPESKTPGAWGVFAGLGIFVLVPIIVLVLSLRKRDKVNHFKPDVRI